MLCLQQLNEGTVRQIRKTAEDPPRVSVYDVLQVVTGCSVNNSSNVYSRVSEAFPEVTTNCSDFKFSGRGQRGTPVAGAHTIVEILMVLPGRAAAQVRPGLSLTGFLIFVSKSLELEGILTSPMCVSKSWGLGESLLVRCV